MRPYEPYVAQTVGELVDKLGAMMLDAPTFVDLTGYTPEQNLETTFSGLGKSLDGLRKTVGEEKYEKLVEMADRMRSLFESDPRDETGDAQIGRGLISAMEIVLTGRKTYQESEDPAA